MGDLGAMGDLEAMGDADATVSRVLQHDDGVFRTLAFIRHQINFLLFLMGSDRQRLTGIGMGVGCEVESVRS